jgi:starvation-inducible DNA-binding protein
MRGAAKDKDMNPCDHNEALHPTRMDIPPEIRRYVIQLLNQTLACTVDLRSYVKQAGWNVRGQDFAPLQALFATMARELDAYADLVAERIAVLGGIARGTAPLAAMQSRVAASPDTLVDGQAQVGALAQRFAPYARAMRGDIALAADVEDADTAAVYTDLSRGVDKQLWVLEAHLHRGSTAPKSHVGRTEESRRCRSVTSESTNGAGSVGTPHND